MRNNREYQICKDIAIYLRLQYPNVIFHFDLAGLNISRAQAGMMKAIQGGRGWPDLFIAMPRIIHGQHYNGAFIEIKKEGEKIQKRNGDFTTPHITEQSEMIISLSRHGYYASFGVGFDEIKNIIDWYLELK